MLAMLKGIMASGSAAADIVEVFLFEFRYFMKRRIVMKFLTVVCLFCFSVAAFGNDTGKPTLAEPAGATSILVSDKAPAAATAEAPKQTATVVVAAPASEDARVRRRAFGRGYVLVKHTVTDGSSSTTREVVDECCNVVRSRTVTKSKCDCRDCKCNRCDCK